MSAAGIGEAIAALRRGEVVGLPTETVYGLAADAGNVAAVQRIFALKGRPADHPLIVHVAGIAQLREFARELPDSALRLAERFWPGPLTLILKRAPSVPDVVTGGQESVGLRCPAHPLALQLLREFGGGLAAPSANRFGRISPTSAAHVRAEFGAQVPIVLDGGDSEVGIESTIVDLTAPRPRVLRPGGISLEQLRECIGEVEAGPGADSPRASGTLEAHYAPRTPMLLLGRESLEREAVQQRALGQRVGLLALDTLPAGFAGEVLPGDPVGYAHGLYAALRALDAGDAHLLLVQRPPEAPAWVAVNDRLRRAAAGAAPAFDSP